MKKCVFYGRYSSVMQNEQSIEGQLHVAEKYAADNDYEIIGHYIDRAISGTSDKRPEFQRMISDSSRGEFEAVLVYKLDRFARNRYDSAIYKKKLRDCGIRVISATENIADTPEGVMMEAFVEAMDEYYSAELGRKMKRGKEESLKKGRFLGGKPPFGYKVVDHKLELDEAKAPIALEIFRRYADGETQKAIAEDLTARGFTNSEGRPWNAMNVSNVLRCSVYLGRYHAGTLAAEGTAPQIITQELFDRVCRRREEFITAHRRTYDGFDFYLTGKLLCTCGDSLSGFSTRQGQYHYYRCNGKCGVRNYRAETLHKLVYDTLQEYLTEDKINELAAAAYEEYQKNVNPVNEREIIEREIASVEQKLLNAVNAVLSGLNSKAVKDTIEELESRRDKLRAELNEVSPPAPKLTLDHFIYALTDMYIKASAEEQKQLIDTIVNKVYISPEQAIICINLTDEDNSPPLEQVLLSIKGDEA
ncbi:MAG: recombinase family protein [Ruminococcus sp.]|nr:recombinase family protein [Ruminococcus sp.]